MYCLHPKFSPLCCPFFISKMLIAPSSNDKFLSAYLIFLHTVVVIGFQPDQYTVDEGAGSVNFTVLVIDGQLDFDVVVEFFTEDGSAQGMYEAAKRQAYFSINLPSLLLLCLSSISFHLLCKTEKKKDW